MPENPFKKFAGFEWLHTSPRPLAKPSFLNLSQFTVRHRFDDNSVGPYYNVETVNTPCLDAVVILIHTRIVATDMVILRHGLRPSVAARPLFQLSENSMENTPAIFWELPAGGIEADDWRQDDPHGQRAQIETWEEVGLRIDHFLPLGAPLFLASAFCPERIHYMTARLTHMADLSTPPPGDGHPMEQGAWCQWLKLSDALQWCHSGKIVDAKTELGLRRLQDYLKR